MKYWLIELNNHGHCLVPWIKALEGERIEVFVHSPHARQISDCLKDYDIRSELRDFGSQLSLREIIRPILQRSDKPRVIIVSSVESVMPLRLIWRLFLIAFLKPQVLCIRNIGRWKKSEREISFFAHKKELKNKLKFTFLSSISFILEKFVLASCKSIVLESLSQEKLLLNYGFKMAISKPRMVFSGRLPWQEVISNPNTTTKTSATRARHIHLGILGSIRNSRRDYSQLLSTLETLDSLGFTAQVSFLGKFINEESMIILRKFSPYLFFHPTEESPIVSEIELVALSQQIDFLISPLSEQWGYEKGWSTGAIADSEFLSLPLLVPKFAGIDAADSSVVSYGSNSELLEILISWPSYSKNRKSLLNLINLRDFINT